MKQSPTILGLNLSNWWATTKQQTLS